MQKHQAQTVSYDEGFPFIYDARAVNYGKSYADPIITNDEEGRRQAQRQLYHGSEAVMAAEYKLRDLLRHYIGRYVEDQNGTKHEAVSFTNNGAIFYRMTPNSNWAVKHDLPYTSGGIAECRRLLLGAI